MTFFSTKTLVAAAAVTAGLAVGSVTLSQAADRQVAVSNERASAHVHVDSAVDIKDDRRVVGIADSVFFGEVLQKTGQTQELSIPETQYAVRVLGTIKGSVSDVVTVNQFGGVKDGHAKLLEGDALLEPGKTYLFVTRTRAEKGWNTIVAGAGAIEVRNDEHRRGLEQRFQHARNNEIPYRP